MKNEAPERIWLDDVERMHAFLSSEDCEGCYGGKGTPYRRADLPPTLAEALAVPEVAALVDAALSVHLRKTGATREIRTALNGLGAALARIKGDTP